ncbi:MAG: integrase arm-type DNA-binding domain-containing protein [Steroidobacteraceae bacterium]
MLTDTQVRGAKSGERARRIADRDGLYLQVDPRGGRYWRFNYRFSGKQKTLALGVYPDVSLAKARVRLGEARELLADGIDPSARKKEVTKTFEAVAREWHARWSAHLLGRYADYVLKRLEADVFPSIGRMSPAEIPTSAFRDLVKKIEARGALEIARRVLQNCGQVMRYAVAHDYATRNPVVDVRPSDILRPRKRRHYPRVDAKELPALLHAIDSYVGGEHTRLALKLMSLTFVRTSELIGARWPEFAMAASRWNIPAERMKMKTPHIVPLSTQAKSVLEQLKAISYSRDLVFPGDVNPARPMSGNTILFALYRMGYRGRMTGHGFRGVASTLLHERGWPHEHIELQLAHQERDEISAAYNHALYLDPRAKMMQAWADHLDGLLRQPEESSMQQGREEYACMIEQRDAA